MSVDWSVLSQVATTISAVLGAASLLAGFIIYYISKRDTFVDKFRFVLVSVRTKIERLNQLVTFELAHELVGPEESVFHALANAWPITSSSGLTCARAFNNCRYGHSASMNRCNLACICSATEAGLGTHAKKSASARRIRRRF